MKLMDGFDSNYRFVLVAARRARQLQGGSRPGVDTTSSKACRVAQDEVAAGKVLWEIPVHPPVPVAEPALELFGDGLTSVLE